MKKEVKVTVYMLIYCEFKILFFFSEKTKQTTVYIFCWESNKTNSEEKRWIILRQIIFRNLKPNL